ncbi:hypothetical protein HPB47_016384, partial [Ixodes persulcatus]
MRCALNSNGVVRNHASNAADLPSTPVAFTSAQQLPEGPPTSLLVDLGAGV